MEPLETLKVEVEVAEKGAMKMTVILLASGI